MARYLNAASDSINCGDVSALNDYFDGGGTVHVWSNIETWQFARFFGTIRTQWVQTGTQTLQLTKLFDTTNGQWRTDDNAITVGEWEAKTLRYDADSTTNDPVIDVAGTKYSIGGGNLTELQTPVGTRRTDSGFDFTIGSDASFACLGDLEHGAVWSDELDDEHVNALSRGVNPFVMRNDILLFYIHLQGHDSPEKDYVGGVSGTLTSVTKSTTNAPVELLENFL